MCQSQQRWGRAHLVRPRGLLRLWLWHGTLPGVCCHLRTSCVAFPSVLERLSNTPATTQSGAARTKGKGTAPVPGPVPGPVQEAFDTMGSVLRQSSIATRP